jgi:hypothetical protein
MALTTEQARAAASARWAAFHELQAKCAAGEHSDECPRKKCPVKLARDPAVQAELDRKRRSEIARKSPGALKAGYDPRRENRFNGLAAGGWKSDRIVAPLAQDIKQTLLENADTADYLRNPEYEFEVNSWAYTEAQLALARARQDELGMAAAEAEEETEDEEIVQEGHRRRRVTVKKRYESVSNSVDKLEKLAAAARTRLGLTPMSRARLGAAVTEARKNNDLAQMLADYQKQREQEKKDSAEEGHPGEGPRAIPPPPEAAPA